VIKRKLLIIIKTSGGICPLANHLWMPMIEPSCKDEYYTFIRHVYILSIAYTAPQKYMCTVIIEIEHRYTVHYSAVQKHNHDLR